MPYVVKQSDCRTGWYVADSAGRPVPYTMTRRRETAQQWADEMNTR